MIINRLPVSLVSVILKAHNIPQHSRQKAEQLHQIVHSHDQEICLACPDYACLFIQLSDSRKKTKQCQPVTYQRKLTSHSPQSRPKLHQCTKSPPFPPQPNSKTYMEEVAYSFCQATTPSALQEVGCGVCGMLKTGIDFSILAKIGLGTTRKERRDLSEKIQELKGPVIDGNCAHVCSECSKLLSKKKIPLLSLANGNWLGDIPIQLT
ncbi:hypothetical protein K439DRAFT_1337330, partial [Ramaria rubella]